MRFRDAAERATKGQVSAGIAPYIERLTFASDGGVDVPDFVALCAWSLLEAVRRQPLKLFTCPTCKSPWLGAPTESKFCQRLAPDHPCKTCRELDYEHGLAGRPGYAAYRREYQAADGGASTRRHSPPGALPLARGERSDRVAPLRAVEGEAEGGEPWLGRQLAR